MLKVVKCDRNVSIPIPVPAKNSINRRISKYIRFNKHIPWLCKVVILLHSWTAYLRAHSSNVWGIWEKCPAKFYDLIRSSWCFLEWLFSVLCHDIQYLAVLVTISTERNWGLRRPFGAYSIFRKPKNVWAWVMNQFIYGTIIAKNVGWAVEPLNRRPTWCYS